MTASEKAMRPSSGHYLDIVYPDIGHARVLQVLAETANGDSVPANDCHVADVDVVRSWLDRNTVISALVYEIGELNVL